MDQNPQQQTPFNQRVFELEQEKKLRDALDKEREESKSSYAVKLVEKIVFAIVGLMGTTMFGALVKVAIDYIGHYLH